MKKYICIDIGGTAIKYGVADENGTFLERHSTATNSSLGGAAIKQKVVEITKDLLSRHNAVGVCISTAGMVDVEKGEIFHASSLIPNYIGTNFKKLIYEHFQLPCEVENDVRCAGLAEATTGAAKGASPVLCLTIGTGIGGCVVIDGNILHGVSSGAGEIGYTNMRGTEFQRLGSSRVLTANVAERKNADPKEWNGIRIFDAARNGDKICREEIEKMTDVLGYGIANMCYVLNPEVVVLGGGIMAEEEYMRPLIEKAVSKYLIPIVWKNTRIEFAKHRNNAGMLGALYNFKKRTER